MDFRQQLEGLCTRVDGAVAASLMGYDGLAVETHEVDRAEELLQVPLGAAMVEYAQIFTQARAAAGQLQAGEASEISLRTTRLVAVARAVSPEYFVVMALTPKGNVGKARYALRVGAGQLAAEL